MSNCSGPDKESFTRQYDNKRAFIETGSLLQNEVGPGYTLFLLEDQESKPVVRLIELPACFCSACFDLRSGTASTSTGAPRTPDECRAQIHDDMSILLYCRVVLVYRN
jgi:hypothetical protein